MEETVYPVELNPWAQEVAEAAGEYRRIRPGGGYRGLRSFQTTTIIYDGTVVFCDQWISKQSRTHDQMVQAARSGRQNIAEGSRASTASSSSELFLTNVSRASLDELLLDYEDVLRQRKFPQWEAGDVNSQVVRKLFKQIDAVNREGVGLSHRKQDEARWAVYAEWLESGDPEKQANTLICLIHQANYLLDQQITALEQAIVEQGGYKEQLTKARLQKREPQPKEAPQCPDCGKPMRLRNARTGKNAGSTFWGCGGYPECRGTREYLSDPTDLTDPSDLSEISSTS